jgi:hypothetical protein
MGRGDRGGTEGRETSVRIGLEMLRDAEGEMKSAKSNGSAGGLESELRSDEKDERNESWEGREGMEGGEED